MLTNRLDFFYKLNRELKKLKLKFKILNFSSKIPDNDAVILTTQEEMYRIAQKKKGNTKILLFREDEDLEDYIIRILVAHKSKSSEYKYLLFSLDPGEKKSGLGIFINGYYINSTTFIDKKKLFQTIQRYEKVVRTESNDDIRLEFKFGRGVPLITLEYVSNLFQIFTERENLNVYLIDEYRSSKIKLDDKKKIKLSKHEISALILAIRDGIEVKKENFVKVINNLIHKKLKKSELVQERFNNTREKNKFLNSILKALYIGEITLLKARREVKNYEKKHVMI